MKRGYGKSANSDTARYAGVNKILSDNMRMNLLNNACKFTDEGGHISMRLGGDITVSNELGIGSTFTIRLPCKYRRKKSLAPLKILSGRHVLLAEELSGEK